MAPTKASQESLIRAASRPTPSLPRSAVRLPTVRRSFTTRAGPTLIFGDVAAGGTDVVANPTGGPFVRDLTAVRIDGLDYNVAGSGGGSADGVAGTASFAQSADKLSTTMTPARAAWPQ